MKDLEEKLVHFNTVILNDAASERDKILTDTKNEIERMIEFKKKEFIRKADEILKKETAQAEKEKNIVISKAVIESKQLIIDAREEIINSLFSEVRKMLEDFVHKDEYRDFLLDEIRKSVSAAGKGQLIVYLGENDMKRFSRELENLKKDFPGEIHFEATAEDIIGGCRVLNVSDEFIVDNTLQKKLDVKREEFIMTFTVKIPG